MHICWAGMVSIFFSDLAHRTNLQGVGKLDTRMAAHERYRCDTKDGQGDFVQYGTSLAYKCIKDSEDRLLSVTVKNKYGEMDTMHEDGGDLLRDMEGRSRINV